MLKNKMIFPQNVEKYITLQCNGDKFLYTDFPEYKAIKNWLPKNPKYALDIGCGIGRASVWFHKNLQWDTKFFLYDGNSGEKQIDEIGDGGRKYYNSIVATESFVSENGLKYEVLNAEAKIGFLPPIDLAYSFLAFGFHWPVWYCLNIVDKWLAGGCVVIFGIRGIEKKRWINEQISKIPKNYKIRHFSLVKTSERKSVLVLEKEHGKMENS